MIEKGFTGESPALDIKLEHGPGITPALNIKPEGDHKIADGEKGAPDRTNGA